METVVTRSSNNYGPFQFPEKLIPLAIHNAMEQTPIPVYGDGFQIRDWIHVADNCRALMTALEDGRSGATYHIGGGNQVTNLELLRLLLKNLGKSETLLTRVTDRLGHDRRYAIDCSLIRTELGWTPEISLEDGLRATVEWYQSNRAWIADATNGEYQTYYERVYGREDAKG